MQTQRRGIIVLESGKWEEVPEFGLDRDLIAWPLAMPETKGEPPKVLTSEDFYKRHKIEHEDFYVFLQMPKLFSR
jgi:hypothetical protein